jgi:hypothetical protein
VRVSISGQEANLEKQHTGCPNSGPSAEPWQDELRYQRLNLEKKECTEKNSEAKDGYDDAVTRARPVMRWRNSSVRRNRSAESASGG